MAISAAPPLFFFTFITFILLLQQITSTVGSPLAPISLSIITNATTPATSTALNNIQCIHSSVFVTDKFLAGDCFSAILLFQDNEVERHSSTMYEFFSSTLTPIYRQFAQPTPRKYTYKSCTMAIAMIADLIPLGISVPGLPSPPERKAAWGLTDLCDYVSIEKAVLNIRDGCLSIVLDQEKEEAGGGGRIGAGARGGGSGLGFANPVGWDMVGIHGNIGVFLWDTNSLVNQVVKEGWGDVGARKGGNGTGLGGRIVLGAAEGEVS